MGLVWCSPLNIFVKIFNNVDVMITIKAPPVFFGRVHPALDVECFWLGAPRKGVCTVCIFKAPIWNRAHCAWLFLQWARVPFRHWKRDKNVRFFGDSWEWNIKKFDVATLVTASPTALEVLNSKTFHQISQLISMNNWSKRFVYFLNKWYWNANCAIYFVHCLVRMTSHNGTCFFGHKGSFILPPSQNDYIFSKLELFLSPLQSFLVLLVL